MSRRRPPPEPVALVPSLVSSTRVAGPGSTDAEWDAFADHVDAIARGVRARTPVWVQITHVVEDDGVHTHRVEMRERS